MPVAPIKPLLQINIEHVIHWKRDLCNVDALDAKASTYAGENKNNIHN